MSASAPNIISTTHNNNLVAPSGAEYRGAALGTWSNAGSGSNNYRHFDASRCSSIYGASNTIRPISKQVRFIIKF